MKWLLAALGLLMVVAGGYWAFTGSLIVQIERGWSALIAGTVVFSAGFLTLAIAALMGSVDRLARSLREAQGAAPRPVADRPKPASAAAAAAPQASVASDEADDKSQLKLELVSAPAPIAAAFTPTTTPLKVVTTSSPPVDPATEPDGERASLPPADKSAPSVRLAQPPTEAAPAPVAPPQVRKPQAQPVRPAMPRPAPPTPAGRPTPPPPPAGRARPVHPALVPPPPPAPDVAEARPPSEPVPDADQPPIPAPRPTEPRKVGWLERALEGAPPEAAAAPKTAISPAAPTPASASALEAPANLAERGKTNAPRVPDPPDAKSAATDMADEDAARVAQTAQASLADPPTPDELAAQTQPPFEAMQPPEPVRLPTDRPDDLEQATPARRIPEPPALADLPKIMRKYESQGVSYTLYEDGSIDADSSAGRFRFASLDELRAFLEPKS